MKRHIPNTLTCLNLFSGCLAVVMAFDGQFTLAFAFILLSAVFDFFDGLAARALDAHSPIGKDLDSLADDVSFGVAPASMLFNLLQQVAVAQRWGGACALLPYVAFLIAVFSALRLAKFNNDSRQTTSFIGLPVPANALFWASYVLFLNGNPERVQQWAFPLALLTLALVLLFSWLLVSEIPMFSLKKMKSDRRIPFFFIGCIPLFALFSMKAFVPIIIWYILLSLIGEPKQKKA